MELSYFLNEAKVQLQILYELSACSRQGQLPQLYHLSVSGNHDVQIDCRNTLGDEENDTSHLNRPLQATCREEDNGRQRAAEKDAMKEREEKIRCAVESLGEEVMILYKLFNRYAREIYLH